MPSWAWAMPTNLSQRCLITSVHGLQWCIGKNSKPALGHLLLS
jgi:hypothetical protein